MSDLAIFTDTSALDRAASDRSDIVAVGEQAKSMLALWVEQGEFNAILRLKGWAEAAEVLAASMQLGKDSEVICRKVVLRAQRSLGAAIRRGQEEGTVLKAGEAGSFQSSRRNFGSERIDKPSPTQWLKRGNEMTNTYAISDGVSDEQFEEAMAEAEAENNLTMTNVVRKVRKDETPAPKDRPVSDGSATGRKRYVAADRPEHLRGLRHIDPNRVVEQTILGSGIPTSVAEQIDYSALDRDRLEGWVSSLSEVIKSLQTLNNNLKKELTQ